MCITVYKAYSKTVIGDYRQALEKRKFNDKDESKVKASEVSERTREGLKELYCFNHLIHLEQVSKAEMEHLLENLPNTYASQLALMAWFVALASKMAGKEIPGVDMA